LLVLSTLSTTPVEAHTLTKEVLFPQEEEWFVVTQVTST